MSVYDVKIAGLTGRPDDVIGEVRGKAALVVNVASKCGFTPQYAGLQKIHDQYADRGFTVIGVPCNQFGAQEPGAPEEIEEFCSVNYGVTFPITEKIDVNGAERHPLFEHLTQQPDPDGNAGDIGWNFEKFLVSPEGEVVARWRTGVEPEDDEIAQAIEGVLRS